MSNATVFTNEELLEYTAKELKSLEAIPRYKSRVLDFRAWAEANAAELALQAETARLARVAHAKTLTYTVESLGGQSFTYAEILMLATISVKKWYDMPEENPVDRINKEIAQILDGIQSREANALKAAIAEAVL